MRKKSKCFRKKAVAALIYNSCIEALSISASSGIMFSVLTARLVCGPGIETVMSRIQGRMANLRGKK
jgi:hypothetical protein